MIVYILMMLIKRLNNKQHRHEHIEKHFIDIDSLKLIEGLCLIFFLLKGSLINMSKATRCLFELDFVEF